MSYKILNLHAENVKRLKVVDITPDPENNIVTITGANGQGKTSVLDSIFWALAGKKGVQEKPIRDGEEKATIIVDIGEYVIKRTFTEKGSYLTVENSDGFKSSNPQEMLDKIIGAISFDPLDFCRQDKKKQYNTLRELVTIDIDIESLDQRNAEDFELRKDINRDVKGIKAQFEAIEVPQDLPTERVDVSALSKEIILGREAVNDYNQIGASIENTENKMVELSQKYKELEERLKNQTDTLMTLSEHVPNKDKLASMQREIESAGAVNEGISRRERKNELIDSCEAKAVESAKLTLAMDKRNEQKANAIERAEMPIDLLSFNDGAVTYKGVPFTQASNAEQIKVSTAIAMAMNPKLRVIRIKDGSLLDEGSMNTMKEMAKDNDFQVWIERVSDNDPVAIVIEDGEVKS